MTAHLAIYTGVVRIMTCDPCVHDWIVRHRSLLAVMSIRDLIYFISIFYRLNGHRRLLVCVYVPIVEQVAVILGRMYNHRCK